MIALSPREREVLGLMAKYHYSHSELAEHLGVTPRTARQYTERLRFKLGVSKTRHIVPEAVRCGLLHVEVR